MLRRLSSTVSHMSTRAALPSTMQACAIQSQGSLDVIALSEVPVPQPAADELVYRVAWAGVNFIDTYQRSGLYPLKMPFILGNESSGTVVAVGSSVDTFAVGDEVVSYSAGGGFAEFCLSKATRTAKVPAGMGVKDAATGLLQGLTAVTLTHEAHEVKKGQYILIPACAGGLGLLLTQICTLRGAIVIGTCSTPAKALLAKAAGAAHVFLSDGSISDEELVGEIHKITGGEGIDRGVSASFDGVGKDTFELSMAALRRKGTMVTCGNASGAVPAFAPLRLAPKALKICRPVLNQYIHTPSEFTQYSTELFGLIARGELKLSRWKEEGYEFSAQGIKSAQEDIMSRKTTGKLLVKVGA